MSEQDYSEARKIFEEYNGSFFFMDRDGEYQKYKGFQVPREIEASWISERKTDIVEKLYSETDESKVAELFSQYRVMVIQDSDEKGLLFMLEFAGDNQEKWDTFTNVRVAETILDSINGFNNKYKTTAINISLRILKSIKDSDFRVSDCYKEIGYLTDCLEEDKIRERINRNIKACEDELKTL